MVSSNVATVEIIISIIYKSILFANGNMESLRKLFEEEKWQHTTG
jgi:hypothetical protein